MRKPDRDPNDLLTADEFAAMLKVKVSTVRRWWRARPPKIRVVHITPQLVRIPYSEYLRILQYLTPKGRLASGKKRKPIGIEPK